MRLNLGAGRADLPGFTSIDRKDGQEAYPLAYPDSSADEIRASHILEHFGHREIRAVLSDWVRVLKPGGILRVAVPDFRQIVKWYAEGRGELPLQSYVLGSQLDENDYHKSLFDQGLLTRCLTEAGLTDIQTWKSELSDAASSEVSLNLQGTKPAEVWPLSEASNKYSQFGEDGILADLFEKIGTENKWCVDVGAADGTLFSNVRQFIEDGWKGVLIEADPDRYEKLRADEALAGCFRVKAMVGSTGPDTLDSILTETGTPEEFDLLSIDIDGQDYYIWNSLLKFKPRVVVIEYDPQVDSMFIPPLNGSGQAGWNAITHVAAARGYNCIARTQTNLICVRRDVLNKLLKSGYQLVMMDEGNSPSVSRPVEASPEPVKIIAVASVPRLGFNATWHCTLRAMLALGIKMEMVEGVFWGDCLTRGIEKALKQDADIILTVDYDTVFDVEHVIKLGQLLADHPEYDIIVPRQMKRESDQVLFQMNGSRDFAQPLTPIKSGHFGLTVFDKNVFTRMPKPWFLGVPNAAGDWGEGRTDPDMFFWQQIEKAGLRVALANEVSIGHLELQVCWPSEEFKKVTQTVSDYREMGQPLNCGGNLKTELGRQS